MVIYLINKETNEMIQIYYNVITWDYNSVTYLNRGYLSKIYAKDNELFIKDYKIEEWEVTDEQQN